MTPFEAKDIIQRMCKGDPTEIQIAALELAYEALERMAQYAWIPVSECFPEKSGYYLVQTDRELSTEDYTDRVVSLYDAKEGYFLSCHDYIVAWQPLPEPYKERE